MHYYRKDHLGNNREVWRSDNNAIVQRTQYYPSGLPWAEGLNPDYQNHKYNGKEFIEMHGYDTYDYGARGMYPAIMRFTIIDPLAEKYYSVSPYAYCANNPIRFIDPNGMWYGEPEKDKKTLFLDQLHKAFNALVGVFAHNMGVHPAQLQSENPAVREDASQKREATISTLNAVNETLLSPIPGGEIGYKLATDQKISKETIAWEAVGVIPVGKVGKVAAKSGVQYTKSSLKLGQEMHNAYKVGANGIKEFRLPSGKRIDFLDVNNGVIHELKPFNPRAMKSGQKQLNIYLQEMQSPSTLLKHPEFKGIQWKTILDTY